MNKVNLESKLILIAPSSSTKLGLGKGQFGQPGKRQIRCSIKTVRRFPRLSGEART
jgi:hypothetical protein